VFGLWDITDCVSARTGTAYAGIRTDLGIYRRGAKALAEGLSLRGTGRRVEARTGKDTVMHWLPILGQHGQGVMNYFFRDLHLGECQFATRELWTFIYKKEAHLTPLEKLAEVYGDAWAWDITDLLSVRCANWRPLGWSGNALCPTRQARFSAETGHGWTDSVLHQDIS